MKENENKMIKPSLKLSGIQTNTYGLKVILITLMLFLFLIPVNMIKTTLNERQWRRSDVENEIVHSWGGETALGGPVLAVPRKWQIHTRDKNGHIVLTENREETVYLLPESLDVKAVTNSEVKYRGIYSVPVFTLFLQGSGQFDLAELDSKYDRRQIEWEKASLLFSYPQLKGMKKIDPLVWNSRSINFEPGSQILPVYNSVMSAPVPVNPADEGNLYSFSFRQEIQGGRQLNFLPLAKNSRFDLESDWADPSFTGYYLPSESRLRNTAFSALWEINYLSRSIPQVWSSSDIELTERLRATEFGVRFFPMITSYNKTERTLKYSLLFLILPFMTFFLFEIIRKIKIHPAQYFLAGTANLLFYLLLLSLAEHMNFNGAYIIASSAVSLLLTFYAMSVLKARLSGLILLPVMSVSYIYLYFVLQSEDYALLMGSAGLFVITGSIMWLTRKVQWYSE